MTAQPPLISNIAFATSDLLDAVGPLPSGMRGGVWDLTGQPRGMDLEEVDAVVLPYMGMDPDWAETLRSVPNLKLVQTQSTGYEGIPGAVGPSVAVASAAGVHAASTAELAMALMLTSLRGLDVVARDQASATWRSVRRTSMADRRVLLVGVGGIGAQIARRLEPFEVELTRVGSTARDDEFGHVHGADELADLAPRHDVLVLITPLNEHTRHLADARLLAALPDGALVVNVARGAVVDSDALTAEVVSGRLRAAVDVFDPEPMPANHPLWLADNALVSPHLGGNTSAFMPRMVALLQEQLTALAAGRTPANLAQRGPF